MKIQFISICAMISTKTSQEFVLPKTSKNFELSEEDQFNILRCAKEGLIFSHLDPTKKCHSPLTRGPCDTDEVVVIDQQTLLGTCIYKPCNDLEWWDGEKCQFVYNGSGCDGDNVRRWYNLTGGITCDCEYGWARQTSQGECQQYSTQAWCPEGQLLQEISVPKDCNCVPKDECQSFQDDVEYLKNNKNNISLERLRIRNCGEKGGERKVCCNEPSVKTNDLSFQEVLNSFVKSMTANVGCLPNPCPNDEIPWPGYPDKCFQKTEKTEDCTKLRLIDEELSCHRTTTLVLFSVSSVTPRKCKHPKKWNSITKSCIRPIFL